MCNMAGERCREEQEKSKTNLEETVVLLDIENNKRRGNVEEFKAESRPLPLDFYILHYYFQPIEEKWRREDGDLS